MAERPPIRMVRRGSFLTPASPTDGVQLERFPAGKELNVRASQPRSIQQHRLYFSMLDLIAENLDQELTGDDLHEWVKIKLGYVKPIRLKNGQIAEVPGSIAFDKMEQPEFQTFFNRAKALLVEHVIPGIGSDALEREARLMLGEAA